ncbi:MAG: hypothetical protein EOP53_20555 [Sphingobacteriales bacterium]|nr:MAG: hypothetical protein EOP53_20555 [Sphingobacteriales bacterium]
MTRILYSLVFFSLFAINACRSDFEGDVKPNQAPETYTVVDTIFREGSNRFPSSLEVKWWGSDADGFVTGYEISSDGTNWKFTKRQDTSFIVDIPAGSDTFNYQFYVRAIDNNGLKDQSPATLSYPVKNSAPTVSFTYSTVTPTRRPLKSFPVTRWSWSGNDPDGFENLDKYELIWNDTTQSPYTLSKSYSEATLEGLDWSVTTTGTRVYPGSLRNALAGEISGLKLNDSNVLYIRAIDKVGAKSRWNGSYKIYIRKPVSKTLLVNANSTRIDQAETFYKTNLQAAGITNFDVIRVREIKDNNYTELSPDNFTQSLIFQYFDAHIWFGNQSDYTLGLAQRTTESLLDKGGKLFIATNFSAAVDLQAGYLEFTPIDSLVNPPAGSQFRLNVGAPVRARLQNWPDLKAEKIVSSARPFYEEFGATPLYDAEITRSSSSSSEVWSGKSVIMAKRNGSNGKANFIICSLELDNLNGNGNMPQLFKKLFVDEFEIK